MDTPEIRYQCQRCGACCRWPGEVVLSEGEISAMAAQLGQDEHEFIQQRTELRRARSGLTLAQKPDGSCTLLEGKTCIVHDSKPAQCRAFPNTWRFPGWRQLCEATPERVGDGGRD
jgi:Fe-S-cluster containining protein